MATAERPAPLLLFLALSCAPARGLQSAGLAGPREGTSVYVEGLTPENWHTAFDFTSPRGPPRIHVPPSAVTAQSIQEHTRIAQESARAIGRQMGVPYMPHDFAAGLGDGSVEGIRAKAREHFGQMARAVPGVAGVTDFLLAQTGEEARQLGPEEAFESYSMVAQRLGARSLANQLAPLLRATTPPNPSYLFSMIGNILANQSMPRESVEFYREMARMYSAVGAEPTMQSVQSLQNLTMALSKNRTMAQAYAGPRPARRSSVPDYYKSASNLGIVLFSLPCAPGAGVCFSLTSEFYSFKSGPGFYSGVYHPGSPGGYAVALGIATETPWSFISTPFYLWPHVAVGHEYDLKLAPGRYKLPERAASSVSAIVKLRESSDCLGTGTATTRDPRVDTCPYAGLALAGGAPQVFSVLEILPVRTVQIDSLVNFYDVMKYGGPLQGPYTGEVCPSWAWAGFYRQVTTTTTSTTLGWPWR